MWWPDPFFPNHRLLEHALPTAFSFVESHPPPPLGPRGAYADSLASTLEHEPSVLKTWSWGLGGGDTAPGSRDLTCRGFVRLSRMPDPGHLSPRFENDAAFKRHACGGRYTSASAQCLHRATWGDSVYHARSQVWLSSRPDNTKGYHYDTCCPYWPTFAVLLSKKLKRVNCYNVLYPGSQNGLGYRLLAHLWGSCGRLTGKGRTTMGTCRGHRKYLKCPLTPVFVYISAVPPVVTERRANLSCGRKSKCVCMDSRGRDKQMLLLLQHKAL